MGFGEEIQGISAQDIYERIHPDDRHISFEQQKEVASGKVTSKPAEYCWKVNSGNTIGLVINVGLSETKRATSSLIGTIGYNKHKKVEQALKASHMRLTLFLKVVLVVFYSLTLMVEFVELTLSPTYDRLREDELLKA